MPDLPRYATPIPSRGDLHATRCSDGIAILDIADDAYLSLYAPRPAGGSHEEDMTADRARVERSLRDAGLLSAANGCRSALGWAGTPCWRELPSHPASPPPVDVVATFLRALARASILVRVRSFAGLVDEAHRHRAHARLSSEQELAQLVGWFDRLGLWLPIRPLCLFRSLMLLLFLRGRGVDAQWVFGVTLFPFQAHCWLAIDELLVGERADRVEEFVVIFATERRTA